jgi:iron complex outermembrane receptor protein
MKITNCAVVALSTAALIASNNGFAQDEEEAHHSVDQIIVTAKPLARTVEELAQPVSVLHGHELTNKQSTSIGETVSQEPGVSSTYFGPISSRPVIRGQFGERVRVLTNGLDSLDASAFSEDHQVTAESLLAQRIEIVRGPAALLYGSGAAGGLVNVVDTRFVQEPLQKPFNGGLALGADTASGIRDGAVRAQFGSGSLAFSADYFYRSTDDIEIPGFAESRALRELEEAEGGLEEGEEEAFGVVENTNSETRGGALGVSFLSDNGFVGVSFSGFDSEYGIPGHAHEEEAPPLPGEPAEEEFVRIDLEQTRMDLAGEYDIEGSFLRGVRFRAAMNDYEHTELEGEETGTIYDVQGIDSRIELRHARLGAMEGALGIQYRDEQFDAVGDEAFLPQADTTSVSLFLFEEIELSDTWVLQGSARYEDQSISGSALPEDYDEGAFGASIGAVWRAAEDIRVSANLSLSERHPTVTELYADGAHVAADRYERGSVTLGNGILDKETSTNLDLTLHGDTGRWEWTITGFVNSVDDYILLRPTALELDGFQVFDFDQADVKFTGIEAEATVEVLDKDDRHMHVRLFTDFVNAEEDVTGDNLPRIPPQRLGLGLHGGWKSLDATIDAIFADDQDDVVANELPTEGYTLLNASLSYTFADSGVLLFLRGSNLLDEDIRQHTSPLKDLVPLPGRSLHFGLRYEF